MAVYFIADNENPNYDTLRIKIGKSRNIVTRLRNLQTGSPQKLKLMGWIESSDDGRLESELHRKYAEKYSHLEWFNLSVRDVYEELRSRSTNAYISVNDNAFMIIGCDSDGIQEYIGAWQWMDVEHEEFCPQCGWGGGLSFNQNYGGDRCLKCGILA